MRKSINFNSFSYKNITFIISYNDTLLKEIIEGGITTISKDFKKTGIKLAEMIHNNEQGQFENCNSFIMRKSL